MNRGGKDCQTVKFIIDVVNCNDGKKRQRSKTPKRNRTGKSPARPGKSPDRKGKSPARSFKKTLDDAAGDCPCPRTSTPKSTKKPLRTAGKYYTEDDLARKEHSYFPVLPGFINPNTQTLTTLVPNTTVIRKR
jgi:hypothetical protein